MYMSKKKFDEIKAKHMPCLLDEKKIVNYPCSRACPLFGDCVTKWYQVRKRA